MHAPQLLLLDEPTAGVDPKARREFWDEIHALTGEGITVLVSTHYMDEAERCHRINYISYGRLIAEGTVAEVVAEAGLTTRVVTGPGLEAIARRLRDMPGVDQVAAFGMSLHVVGRDAGALDAALAEVAVAPGVSVAPAETSLEDVFIQFMARARRTTWHDLALVAPPPARAPRQGVHPDAARPHHLRDDARGAADPAHAVRLRDQQRPEARCRPRSSPRATTSTAGR